MTTALKKLYDEPLDPRFYEFHKADPRNQLDYFINRNWRPLATSYLRAATKALPSIEMLAAAIDMGVAHLPLVEQEAKEIWVSWGEEHLKGSIEAAVGSAIGSLGRADDDDDVFKGHDPLPRRRGHRVLEGLLGTQAMTAFEANRLQYFARYSEEQRTKIQALIKTSLSNSEWASGGLARDLRGIVGLTPREATAMASRYEAMRIAGNLPAKEISRRFKREARDALRRRAAMVAQNELAAAWNKGSLEHVKQKMSIGTMPASTVAVWLTVGDGSVCAICSPLHLKQLSPGATFDNVQAIAQGPAPGFAGLGAGAQGPDQASVAAVTALRSDAARPTSLSPSQTFAGESPPAHVSCRCSLAYRREVMELPEGMVMREPSSHYQPIPGQEDVEDTSRRYRAGKDGPWTEERTKLHDEIMARHIYKNGVSGELAFDVVPLNESPTLVMLGGGSGAGKGGLAREMKGRMKARGKKGAAKVDADELRQMLPEFDEIVALGREDAAAITHEEASYLNKRIADEIARLRGNLIWDGTGNGRLEKFIDKVERFKKIAAGLPVYDEEGKLLYAAVAANKGGKAVRVVNRYATTSVDEAIKRTFKRGRDSGRYVPARITHGTHSGVSEIWEDAVREGVFDYTKDAAGEAARAAGEITGELWDTNFRPNVKIAEVRGRTLDILDKERWFQFRLKAPDYKLEEWYGPSFVRPAIRPHGERFWPPSEAVQYGVPLKSQTWFKVGTRRR